MRYEDYRQSQEDDIGIAFNRLKRQIALGQVQLQYGRKLPDYAQYPKTYIQYERMTVFK
jgi:hypothetical protein